MTATQDQIDVVIAVELGDGTTVTGNRPTGQDADEVLALESAGRSVRRVRVGAAEPSATEGIARIQILVLPMKNRADRTRIDAYLGLSKGAYFSHEALLSPDVTETERLWRQALESYAGAARAWGELGDDRAEAQALHAGAIVHYHLAEWDLASDMAGTAVALLTGNDIDESLRARVMHMRAQALLETDRPSDRDRAEGLLQDALALQERLDEQVQAAITLNSLGIVDYGRGRLDDARDRFLAAGRMFEEAGELGEASKAFNNVGGMDERLGRIIAAIESYETAIRLARESGFDYGLPWYLENAADAHAQLGDLEQALLLFHEAADLAEASGDRLGTAMALDGIGSVYFRLGNWRSATRYLERSLMISTDRGEVRALVDAYNTLGHAYRLLGQFDDAIRTHQRALAIAGSDAPKAAVYLELGRDEAAAGHRLAAMGHFEQARDLSDGKRAPLVHAAAVTEIGTLLIAADPGRAVSVLSEAMAMHREWGTVEGEAATLSGLARAEQARGRADVALDHATAALDKVEELRRRAGQPRLRYAFTGARWPTYELVINLLMDLGQPERALEVSERARAQTLRELLYEAGERIGADENSGLRAQHRRLRQALAETAVAERAEGRDAVDDAAVFELLAELDRVEAKIRASHGGGNAVVDATPLTAAQIRGLLAPPGQRDDALLLEYSLGEDQSVLWAVTPDSVESFRLPGRLEIEELARSVYELVHMPDITGDLPDAARDSLERLSRLLLGPAVDTLNTERVVVVPDGALHLLPFAALVHPRNGRHLIETHEVVMLPSASVLAAKRARATERPTATSGVAIVADPVFSAADPRMAGLLTRGRSAGTTAASGKALSRLAFTAQEAEWIRQIAGADERVFALTGFEATASALAAAPLSDYQYVHLASHGLVNATHPELSAIALSAFSPEGIPVPSMLQLDDIYELDLNAELVVLSACDTALGTEVRGEGLIGLTHAFMTAGSRGVVATLWAVQDRATAEFMKRFYENLLQRNMSPAEGLRAAQLGLMAERKWRHPYYWAPFSYQGEWYFEQPVTEETR